MISMRMTETQAAAVQHGIEYVLASARRVGRVHTEEIKIREFKHFVSVTVIAHNNMPGTFGYVYPAYYQFFVGRGGRVSAYRESRYKDKNGNKKRVKETGTKALIYCEL